MIADTRGKMHGLVRSAERERQENKIKEIASWLSDLSFDDVQQDIYSRKEEGTGKWFLQSCEFTQWINGPNNKLWCPGIRKHYLL